MRFIPNKDVAGEGSGRYLLCGALRELNFYADLYDTIRIDCLDHQIISL